MAIRSRSGSYKRMIKFFTMRYKLNYNDDESELNSLGFYTRNYESGTYRLNKKDYKVGDKASIHLGYEKKKLE